MSKPDQRTPLAVLSDQLKSAIQLNVLKESRNWNEQFHFPILGLKEQC